MFAVDGLRVAAPFGSMCRVQRGECVVYLEDEAKVV